MAGQTADIAVSPAHPKVGDVVTVTYTPPSHVNGLLGLQLLGEENGKVVYADGGYPIKSEFKISQSTEWPDGHEIQGVVQLYSFATRDPSRIKVLAETEFPLGG